MRNLIVIPAYNEQGALTRTLSELEGLPDGYEILLVNDGSTDTTGELARKWSETCRRPVYVVDLPINSGIGVTVQTGYIFAAQHGGYRYVIQFDADGQHDAAAIPLLIRECETRDLDLCIGSRFLEPDAGGFRSTAARRLGIRFFTWLISSLSGVRVSDPTSGLRCAGPRAWQRFARCYPEDYPEPESLFWCARNHLRIGEVPVRMWPRQTGVSSIGSRGALYYMIKVSVAILLDRSRIKEHGV
ncbi:MAG TPA: glycosyltransferase family 2 protein [Gemmataceae bacterium]|nr:glycosyltransferase family 2 protein [Gemmataceae bacterium]